MEQELTGALEAALGAYSRHFQMMSSFGVAVFGAALFIVSRSIGIIRDKDFVESRYNWLAFVAAIMSALLIATGYVANNAIANFHVDILRDFPTFCAFPENGSPTTFFMDCYRRLLMHLVQAALLFSALGIASLLCWVGFNVKGAKR